MNIQFNIKIIHTIQSLSSVDTLIGIETRGPRGPRLPQIIQFLHKNWVFVTQINPVKVLGRHKLEHFPTLPDTLTRFHCTHTVYICITIYCCTMVALSNPLFTSLKYAWYFIIVRIILRVLSTVASGWHCYGIGWHSQHR